MGSDDGRMFVIAIKIDRLPDESKQTSLATEGGSGDTVIDEVFEEEEAFGAVREPSLAGVITNANIAVSHKIYLAM